MFADNPDVVAVLRQWVRKAEEDMLVAAQLLKVKHIPASSVCFHAQQCVEKYVKALLVNHGIGFPKTHNIAAIIKLLPARARPDLSADDQDRLTEYAVTARYPGDSPSPTAAEARAAVRIARRVRSHVRKRLPKDALK